MRSCNQGVKVITEEPKHLTDSAETSPSVERNCRLVLGTTDKPRHKLIYKIIQWPLCCLRWDMASCWWGSRPCRLDVVRLIANQQRPRHLFSPCNHSQRVYEHLQVTLRCCSAEDVRTLQGGCVVFLGWGSVFFRLSVIQRSRHVLTASALYLSTPNSITQHLVKTDLDASSTVTHIT